MALRVREYWTVAAGCDPTGQAAQERRIQEKKGIFGDGLVLMKMESRTKHVKILFSGVSMFFQVFRNAEKYKFLMLLNGCREPSNWFVLLQFGVGQFGERNRFRKFSVLSSSFQGSSQANLKIINSNLKSGLVSFQNCLCDL